MFIFSLGVNLPPFKMNEKTFLYDLLALVFSKSFVW